MYRENLLSVLAICSMAVIGCGGGGAASAPEGLVSEEPSTEAPAPAESGRDLNDFDVCALIPFDEVAASVNGTPVGEPHRNNWEDQSADCKWEIDLGEQQVVVMVYLYPVEHFANLKMLEDDPQILEGLGDEAFVSSMLDLQRVIVLKAGDIVVEGRAENLDHARKAAELALTLL